MLIPGWDVAREDEDDEGPYVATRRGTLTEYQRAYGALAEVSARDEGELRLLCDAQTGLAERLATAEAARPQVRPYWAGPSDD